MNMVKGRLSESSVGLSVHVGDKDLVIPASVLDKRAGLRTYIGRDVAVGVRSEDMEDASLTPDASPDRHLSGTVTLVEALGSEIVVHFSLKGDAVVTEDTKLVAQETGEGALDMGPAGEVQWVASFSPRSRVRRGDAVDITVDMERVHWFDPDSGEAIRG
jgi:multiple sugar transport system ATP-binding protein